MRVHVHYMLCCNRACLPHLESVWLTGPGPYMCGNSLPSVADIMFCCELEQLTLLNKVCVCVKACDLLLTQPCSQTYRKIAPWGVGSA